MVIGIAALTIYLGSRHNLRALAPRSLVSIEHYNINGKIRFRRLFFALKPCVDGFLSGCKPYLEIDSLDRKVQGAIG